MCVLPFSMASCHKKCLCLCMKLENNLYVDALLIFGHGLRSVLILNAIADLLEQFVILVGVSII